MKTYNYFIGLLISVILTGIICGNSENKFSEYDFFFRRRPTKILGLPE